MKMPRLPPAGGAQAVRQTFTFKIRHSGRWPPALLGLTALGFDSVSSSKNSVMLQKSQGTDFLGRRQSVLQIELRKEAASLSLVRNGKAHRAHELLPSSILFLRTLSLVPGMQADLQELSQFLLPQLESAELIVNAPYQSLLKKHEDLQEEHSELSSKAKRALSDSEYAAKRTVELEKMQSALQERIRKLEAVSDSALQGLLLDWLSSHKGSFSIASFCRQTGISPSRCEEGIEMLLKEGSMAEIPQGYAVVKNNHSRVFKQNREASLPSFRDVHRSLASSASKLFRRKLS